MKMVGLFWHNRETGKKFCKYRRPENHPDVNEWKNLILQQIAFYGGSNYTIEELPETAETPKCRVVASSQIASCARKSLAPKDWIPQHDCGDENCPCKGE